MNISSNVSGNLSEVPSLNECPLSDRQLVPLFSDNAGISRSVYKILVEISDETPFVTYAPLLFPLISFLCLYLRENEVKNVLVVLLGDLDMIPSSTNDWNVFCHLMFVLGRQYASKAYRSVAQTGDKEHHLLHFWPYALWALPLPFLNRVLACYFLEGGKVLLRAGLVLWKSAHRQRSPDKTPFDWKDAMSCAARNISSSYTPQSFLDRMFAIRNFSRANVSKCKRGFVGVLESGEWISPTTSKGYVAFKTKDPNPSTILTPEELVEVIRHLNPYLAQVNHPVSLFSCERHGYSLRTLYRVAGETPNTVLVLETALGEVIGSFCTDPWNPGSRPEARHFFGKGECFVFRIRPSPSVFYHWTQDRESTLSNLFQRATLECLEVGGGAIQVGADLSQGSSIASGTFDSPCLTDFSSRDFLIKSLELLAFQEIH